MSLKQSDLDMNEEIKIYHGSCIICGKEDVRINQEMDRKIYHCNQCGSVTLPNNIIISDDLWGNVAEIAGFLYETENKKIILNRSKINQILNDPRIPKTPMEYLDKHYCIYIRLEELVFFEGLESII